MSGWLAHHERAGQGRACTPMPSLGADWLIKYHRHTARVTEDERVQRGCAGRERVVPARALNRDIKMIDFRSRRVERDTRASTVALPELSPAFLTADDAARYAHDLIGDQRDVEYGGVILRRGSGKYYATRPVKGQTRFFEPEKVLSIDAQGYFITPEGFVCEGFYHSHPLNFAEIKDHFTHWTKEDAVTALSFFSPSDIAFTIQHNYFTRTHYLSGLNGSLIKYVSSGSRDEALYYPTLTNLADPQTPYPVTTMQDYILKVASIGQLSVLQTSEIWSGKTGRLDQSFKIYKAEARLDVTERLLNIPAYSQVYSSLNTALRRMRQRVLSITEHQYGLVLKHRTKKEYVITEPVVGKDFKSPMDHIFLKSSAGEFAYYMDPDFSVFGIYYGCATYYDPSKVPADEKRIFKSFIPPEPMAGALNMARMARGSMEAPALPIYIATRDGALLQYNSLLSPAEGPYLALATGSEDLQMARDVLAGHISPAEYIRGLARAGRLKVLYGSDLWGAPGPVTGQWKAYRKFQRRTHSPLFKSTDDAARYAHKKMDRRHQSVSGGLIYKRQDQRFFVTEPLTVNTESFDAEGVLPGPLSALAPFGCTVAGVYFTHRASSVQATWTDSENQLYRAMFTPNEVCVAIENQVQFPVRYLSCADGSLIKYSPSGSESERQLLARVKPPVNSPEKVHRSETELALFSSVLKPNEFIASVARAGDLQVIEPSPVWGPKGAIEGDTLFPRRGQPPADATVQPACGPVFTQEQDAIRYAHTQMGERETVQFGFVLKSDVNEEYVATRPIPNGYLSLRRVFPYLSATSTYVLPEGFHLCAMYLGAVKKSRLLEADAVYQDFISPEDIATALVTLSTLKDVRYPIALNPPMYLSTASGALLSYVPSSISKALGLDIFRDGGRWMTEQLARLDLTVVSYIRKMAASGELSVLNVSDVWRNVGPVSVAWQPYAQESVTFSPARYALSPVFAFADDAARYMHRQLKTPHTFNTLGGVLSPLSMDSHVALEPEVSSSLFANVAEQVLHTHRHRPHERWSGPTFPTGYQVRRLHFSRDMRAVKAGSVGETARLKNTPWPTDLCYAESVQAQLSANTSSTVGYATVYVSTDDGALLLFQSVGNSSATMALCGRMYALLSTSQGYYEERLHATGTGKRTEQILKEVTAAGNLYVLITSKTWPEPGRLFDPVFEPIPDDAFDWTAVLPAWRSGPERDEL